VAKLADEWNDAIKAAAHIAAQCFLAGLDSATALNATAGDCDVDAEELQEYVEARGLAAIANGAG
jgi:hypothetical protein